MILLIRMSQSNSAPVEPTAPRDEPATPWWEQVEHLLLHAAELSARGGLDPDAFMRVAWDACLQARPGLREEIEDKELRSQLKKLRKRGLVASA